MKLSEKIQEALREQQEINLSDPAVQKRLAAQWGYVPAGAQLAPSVPREAIDKMLTQLMDIAVSNGANSISMPDEYVEVAAWLCGIPERPAPSVPIVPSGLHPLETVRFWADAYTHPGDDNFRGHGMAAALLREYAELRAALAAAPEAKP